MTPPFLQGLVPTLHISHRGGAALAPENTLVAFADAVHRFGTDMLELDVHATADGALVVAHDDSLERCTDGEGPLAARTLAELSRLDAGHRFSSDGGRSFPFRGRGVRIPLLADVLRAFRGVRVNLELKPTTPGLELEVARIVREAQVVERVCLGSEHDEVGARLVAALPEACHYYPRLALTAAVMALHAGEPLEPSPYDVLDMPLHYQGQRLISPAFLTAARAAGKWVNVWTVDDPAELARLIEEGVGGIMTDRPDLLRAALDEAEARRRP